MRIYLLCWFSLLAASLQFVDTRNVIIGELPHCIIVSLPLILHNKTLHYITKQAVPENIWNKETRPKNKRPWLKDSKDLNFTILPFYHITSFSKRFLLFPICSGTPCIQTPKNWRLRANGLGSGYIVLHSPVSCTVQLRSSSAFSTHPIIGWWKQFC